MLGYEQQDAHEFLIALINGWSTHLKVNHGICDAILSDSKITNGTLYGQDPLSQSNKTFTLSCNIPGPSVQFEGITQV